MSVERKLSVAEAALMDLAADPVLTRSQRSAVHGCLSSIRGVSLVRRHVLLRSLDYRSRQLPVGDRDGGCDDAA